MQLTPKIWSLAQTATSDTAASLTAGRFYPNDWQTASAAVAYAAQLQSNPMQENFSLVNEHYAHHTYNHHSNNHSSNHQNSETMMNQGLNHQTVQSVSLGLQQNASNANGYYPSSAKHNGWNSMDELINNGSSSSSSPQTSLLARANSALNGRSNFNCSPVPFLTGNLSMPI
ncbi:hypothetical protein QR98_0035910 [Sarcoptes scabiei]|uniref:Uncharacterized protein n=1 Tax=Sarcoptes scabiei TaxID=52283 RepID=A0A132A275_SARSC|nr:hypothetical protein QR98_0035910 [Sarcoptes scabiei]